MLVMAATLAGACGEVVSTPPDAGTPRVVKDGGAAADAGTACSASTPGSPCSGALRGAEGCDAPIPVCNGATEFVLSVACHYLPDGGQYAVNGIAGAWCYALPAQCQAASSCGCLEQFGGFSHDAGSLTCPGNYFFCIDHGRVVPDLHCNPP